MGSNSQHFGNERFNPPGSTTHYPLTNYLSTNTCSGKATFKAKAKS